MTTDKREAEIERRLRASAEQEAKASQVLASAKSERNRATGDTDADYRGLKIEETLSWQAADQLATLRQSLSAAEARVKELFDALKELYESDNDVTRGWADRRLRARVKAFSIVRASN